MCTCTRCRDADGTCSATTLRRAEMSGSALGRRAAGAGGARRLPAAVRAGAGAPGSGRVHHQGALRRAGRQAKPGGPSQARAETLGPFHRRGRRPAGGGGGPGQPPQRRAAGATLDTITVVGVLPARPVLHLDTGYDYQTAGRCWPSGAWLVRSPTRGLPSPHPGRPSLAGGAYPCVGQPVRQARAGAPNVAGWWWSSGWRWSTPPSSLAGCCGAPGAATADPPGASRGVSHNKLLTSKPERGL
jgi:hypothetical protein